MVQNVLSENINNRIVSMTEDVFKEIDEIVETNTKLLIKLNNFYQNHDEANELLSEITGQHIDQSVTVNLPFYTDFGRHIQFGKHVFLNSNVMLTDLGGITLEDHVLIGPRANLLSVNHPTDPSNRRSIFVKPIVIKRNAWIGGAATILPGVTVGENAIVGANAVVTKDVPANTIVAGNPAKSVKNIDTNKI
nr:DapH/DapD/GlmU-related protein [Mammaliicoccus sp. Marseille-Q6498]